MRLIKITSILLLFLISNRLSYAQTVSCAHCKMDVTDDAFRAKAITKSDKTFYFDAIECLVNYIKTKDESTFKKLEVTDYIRKEYISAIDAVYLKSKAVPSPMGANLSAYRTLTDAISNQKGKDGEMYNWKQLKQRFLSSSFGATSHSGHHQPDAYAPIGIMGDHLHPKGGLMISLRYMNMAMDGNYEGSNKITDELVYDRFMVAPQEMTMQMYMLGLMYAPSGKLTLILMQNIVSKDMDLTARMMMNGMPMLRDFSTSSKGLGDFKAGVLYGFVAREKIALHANVGFNIPIGNIKNRDATPMNPDAKLPYAMQLGTGTYDITLGGTLKGNLGDVSWGVQQLNTFRTGENSQEYRFGNLHELHSWLAYGFSNTLSTSIRISGSSEGNINGIDSELNTMMVTTADPTNYGGELLRGALGVNVLFAKSKLVLSVEIGTPLYQNYNGITMNEKLTVNSGLKYILF